jgi:hypothetical protein
MSRNWRHNADVLQDEKQREAHMDYDNAQLLAQPDTE